MVQGARLEPGVERGDGEREGVGLHGVAHRGDVGGVGDGHVGRVDLRVGVGG